MKAQDSLLRWVVGSLVVSSVAGCTSGELENLLHLHLTKNGATVRALGPSGVLSPRERLLGAIQTDGGAATNLMVFKNQNDIPTEPTTTSRTADIVSKMTNVAGPATFEFTRGFQTQRKVGSDGQVWTLSFDAPGAEGDMRVGVFSEAQVNGSEAIDPAQVETVDLDSLPANLDGILVITGQTSVVQRKPPPKKLFVTTTFQNTGSETLRDVFIYFTRIGDGLVLLNSDDGSSQVGSKLTPASGAEIDPGESITVTFIFEIEGGGRRIEFTTAGFIGEEEPPEPPFAVAIMTPPAGGIVTATPSILVSGTSPGAVDIDVNGSDATIGAGGSFTVLVDLFEGRNAIRATAENATAVMTDKVGVILDTRPPRVAITWPPDGLRTTASMIDVIGEVSDESMALGAGPVSVSTPGATAMADSRGHFVLQDVAVGPGPATIVVTAEDAAGNMGTGQVAIAVEASLPGPRAVVESGGGQTGAAGAALAQPIVVRVDAPAGGAIANHPVEVAVEAGDGAIEIAPGTRVNKTVLRSAADGKVAVTFVLGARAGDKCHALRFTPLGSVAPAFAFASAAAGPPSAIHFATTPQASEAAGGDLRPVFRVSDAAGNPVAGVLVTAEILSGMGRFAGDLTSASAATDAAGDAAFEIGLAAAGGDTTAYRASFAGNPSLPAAASVDSVAVGPVAATQIAVDVSDVTGDPLQNAVVELRGSSFLGFADTAGGVMFNGVAPGETRADIFASAASTPGTGPFFADASIRADVLPGVLNRLPRAFVQRTRNPGLGTTIGGAGTAILDAGSGVRLEVSPGSVPGGPVSATADLATLDRLGALPGGESPHLAVVFQPADEQAAVSFSAPNTAELAAGRELPIRIRDFPMSDWTAGGRATVSADRATVVAGSALGISRSGLIALSGAPGGIAVVTHSPSGSPGSVPLTAGTTVRVAGAVGTAAAGGVFTLPAVEALGTAAGTMLPLRAVATAGTSGAQSAFLALAPGASVASGDFFDITLQPATVGIDIELSALNVAAGGGLTYEVTANLSDGTQVDVTLSSAVRVFASEPAYLSAIGGGNLTAAAAPPAVLVERQPLNLAAAITAKMAVTAVYDGFVAAETFNVLFPAPADSDGDGLTDRWEDFFGFDPDSAGEESLDSDSDLLSNAAEFAKGSHPLALDTDADGAGDGSDFGPLVPEQSSPIVTITLPAAGTELLEGSRTTLRATVADDGGIDEVVLDGATQTATIADPLPGTQLQIANLVVPSNVASVTYSATATDLAARTGSASRTYTVVEDVDAPLVAIISPASGSSLTDGGSVDIVVQVSDDAGVASLEIETNNGHSDSASFPAGPTSTAHVFEGVPVSEPSPLAGLVVTVTAFDVNGNFDDAVATYVIETETPTGPVANSDNWIATRGIENVFDVGENDSVPDGSTFAITSGPTPAVHPSLFTFNSDGTFRYVPSQSLTSISFTYEIDSGSETASASVVITANSDELTDPEPFIDPDSGDEMVTVWVLALSGQNYPLYQFRLSDDPLSFGCFPAPNPHWRSKGGNVFSLQNPGGAGIADPAPSGCGFGTYGLPNFRQPASVTILSASFDAFKASHPPVPPF